MATIDRGGNDKDKKAEKGGGKNFPHLITARQYNPGEIRSLCEIVEEFSRKQVQVDIHETTTARYLDVRTEIEQRARFIDHLLQKVSDAQHALEFLYSQPASHDHPCTDELQGRKEP